MCAITYTLHPLAPGSYDLALNGEVVGSGVRDVSLGGQENGWRAELLEDLLPEQRPSPFSDIEHPFRTLEAVMAWLGGAAVVESLSNQQRRDFAATRRGGSEAWARGLAPL